MGCFGPPRLRPLIGSGANSSDGPRRDAGQKVASDESDKDLGSVWGSPAHSALRRTTLTGMVPYLGIAAAVMTFASVMTFSFGLLREEQVRSERTALAAELAQITTAAQTCVAANYANIRDQLVNDPSGRRTDQGL
jgi:hypothetical protein